MKNTQILIVDDDPKIRTVLRRCLEGEGATVLEAGNKAETLAAVSAHPIDLITLDLDLGDDDGFDVARTVRNQSKVPIIMVTGKDDVIDRVVGLEIGADDYIIKPFHLREVVARIKSVLRRARNDGPPKPTFANGTTAWRFDDLVAVIDEMKLFDRDGALIELTSGEFKLLEVFLKRPKRVLSRDQLMDLIGSHSYTPLDRTIDNQIARLRKKIERNPAAPRLISTIRGIGYSFTCDVQVCKDQPLSNKAESALARSD
ncbi:response regulator transcription factor [Cognatiyoonia sp. IB215182]|uniref:response regulator transcription factor n=1 Tax=Cognatiyoonia sp. IB215182 TaxID=3097353 RepID=UPI002A119C5A|nr:response regulator transcription factor [Cognatiyoonia sp. IB215182]MDX8354986.1 response regulator transcription factor [Cognatiyoonia sp. IB215182]